MDELCGQFLDGRAGCLVEVGVLDLNVVGVAWTSVDALQSFVPFVVLVALLGSLEAL